MRLIKEEEIDEGAYNSENCEDYGSFHAGVQFAEEKTTPLMIEFPKWLDNKFWRRATSNEWHDALSSNATPELFTTEQLLEQFLKSRS